MRAWEGASAARHRPQSHEGTRESSSAAESVPPATDTRVAGVKERLLYDDEEQPRPTATRNYKQRHPALDLSQLGRPDRPARQYLVDGLLPDASLVSIVGASGAGKSTLARSLAFSLALDWGSFADLTVATGRKVLYVDMENSEDDWAEELAEVRFTPTDFAALRDRLFVVTAVPGMLDTERGGREFRDMVADYGIGSGDLVVLDSAQRMTEGGEDDAMTWRGFFRHAGRPLKQQGTAVLILDNEGKAANRGARGSSAKRDLVDVELGLTRASRGALDGVVTLKATKGRPKGIGESFTARRTQTPSGYRYVGTGEASTATARAEADARTVLSWGWSRDRITKNSVRDESRQRQLGTRHGTGWGSEKANAAAQIARNIGDREGWPVDA